MNQELVIRIMPSVHGEDDVSPMQWLVRGQEEGTGSVILQGSFADLQEWSEKIRTDCPEQWPEQTVVLLPGTMAGLQRLPVTPAQKKHLKKALPYLIEETLISNIEETHIVGLPEAGRDAVLVGHIPVACLERLLEQLAEAGISPVSVVPENCLWQSDAETVALLFERGMVTIWSHDNPAQTIDRAALPLVLNQYLDCSDGVIAPDAEAGKTTVQSESAEASLCAKVLFERDENDIDLSRYDALAGARITIEKQEVEGGNVFAALSTLLNEKHKATRVVEFRSGAFKCLQKKGKFWRKWRPVALVAGLWLGLECLFYVGQGFWFQFQAETYQTRNYALYKEINPGDHAVVDVRHRFNSLLKRAGSTKESTGFLNVLNAVSSVSGMPAAKGVAPKSLDFNESAGVVTLNVAAVSFEAVNQYLEALREAGLQATMETANQEGDEVVARLSMKSS